MMRAFSPRAGTLPTPPHGGPRVPRSILAVLCAALILPVIVVGVARAATPAIEDVAAVAEAYGLTCDDPDDLGDGYMHLACMREADSDETNIDLSVTYNVAGGTDGAGARATAATYATPPADWPDLATDVALLFCEDSGASVGPALATDESRSELAGCVIQTETDGFTRTGDVTAAHPGTPGPTGDWTPGGVSTYEGTWTLSAYANDSEFDDPEFALGATLPGSVTIDCTLSDDYCGFETVRDGEEWSVGSLEKIADGELRFVTETELANCADGQIMRTTQEATFGPTAANVTVERVAEPRTCDDGDGTLYVTDTTWTFDGLLVDHVPAPQPADLTGYLASYGLDCTDVDAVSTCRLALTDEDGLDATYEVTTRLDDSGVILAVDALVTSLDASMPSDALSFLRGVAERAPVDDPEDLVAWFDAAVAEGAEPYAAGVWSATWADDEVPPGRTLALMIARTEARPVPPPSDAPAPAPPVEGPTSTKPSFGDSVPTMGEVSADPIVLLQSAALAVLLVFLMPFPGQLFNSTLEAHEDEVRRWIRLDRIGSAIGSIGAFWASWPGVALFTLLAAVLYGFLDPGFGLNLGSLATFLGMLLGIVLVTAAFAVPAVMAHRRIGDRWTLKVVPVSLLIGVACVLLSRLTGFQPGYLYGLLIGLAFARELSAADEGRATAVSAAAMLVVAFAAWLALGGVPVGDGFGVTVLRTTLAALMVAGLEGVVFGLLPMRFLPGEPLYAWNRVLWAGLLGVGAFAFFHILINPASGYLSDTSRTPLLTTVGLLLGFSLVSVAFWAWFRFRREPPTEEAAAT